jgi:hypothetical protein
MLYRIEFYIDKELVEGGDILIEAVDEDWANQVLLLQLNTKTNIPSIFNSYSSPILVN